LYVRRIITAVAEPQQVHVLDGKPVLAAHPRSYDYGTCIKFEHPVRESTRAAANTPPIG
jgi:hypothetical protein